MWWDDNFIAINPRPLNEKDFHTILAFARNNMKVQATADELGKRRDTVGYRIVRIKAITGLDPRNFYDLIKLVDMANSRLDGDVNA